jgi:hypothetical protein
MRGAILLIPQYASMARFSVKKHRDNFTFTLIYTEFKMRTRSSESTSCRGLLGCESLSLFLRISCFYHASYIPVFPPFHVLESYSLTYIYECNIMCLMLTQQIDTDLRFGPPLYIIIIASSSMFFRAIIAQSV